MNSPNFKSEKLFKQSKELFKVVEWVKAVVSYHILVHPYKVRNTQTVEEESEIYHFAQVVDSFMDQFYSLKTYLIRLEILPPETNFAFNLSHVNFNKKKQKNYLN